MLLEEHLSQGIVRGRGGLRGSLRTCEDQRQWGAAHSLCGQLGQVRSQQLQDVRWQGWFQRSLVAVVCPNCQVIGEESLRAAASTPGGVCGSSVSAVPLDLAALRFAWRCSVPWVTVAGRAPAETCRDQNIVPGQCPGPPKGGGPA